MVLEEATSTASDSFASDPVGDPNSGGGQNADPLRSYTFRGIPGPVPIFGPLFGFTDERVSRAIGQQLKFFHQVTGRWATQEEANALAWHTGREYQLASYGPPLGMAAGIWAGRRTRDTWKLPFWTHGEGFSPSVFPSARTKWFEGEYAKSAWRIVRYNLYGWNGVILGLLGFVSYGSTVGGLGMKNDPRLKAYVEGVLNYAKGKQEELRSKRPGGKGPLPGSGEGNWNQQAQNQMQSGTRMGQSPNQGAAASYGGYASQKEDSDRDDASPAGGMYDDRSFEANAGQSTVTQPQTTSKPSSSWSRVSTQSSQPPQQEQVSSGSFLDDYDDASPTAQPSSDTQAPTSSGSAWDRIRRGQQGAPAQKPQPPQQPQSSWQRRSDNKSSTGDNDRQWSKEEAQKEFDERLDRERRGEDFSSTGSGGRW